MPDTLSPTEVAREALRQLVRRQVVPTPDNYLKVYAEIARDPDMLIGERVHILLRALEKILPPGQGNRYSRRIERALKEMDATEVDRAVVRLGQDIRDSHEPCPNWAPTLRQLLEQWQRRQKGLNGTRKRESLERILAGFGNNPNQLLEKLDALTRHWSELPEGRPDIEVDEGEACPGADATPPAPGASPPSGVDDETLALLRDTVLQALRLGVIPRISRFRDLVDEAEALAARAEQANDALAWNGVHKALRQFWMKLALRNDSDDEIMEGLLRLLRLLVENINEIVIDDDWLQGQMGVIREIVDQPLSPRTIHDAELSFRDLIYKQSSLKSSLEEAKATLKNMVNAFLARLNEMSDSTGKYESRIGNYAEQISSTDDIAAISHILDHLLSDTRNMQIDIVRSREELDVTRREAQLADERIQQLEAQLSLVSEMVHKDFLTGTLNRRGMNDAFVTEFARARRLGQPLCAAILDIDHFKRFNDTHGHDAGDAALIHLVNVVKAVLRPTDVLARFGGEEFVLLMPGTTVDDAVKVMERVQRELTKRFFLHENQRLLITFSCGVALWRTDRDEDEDSLIKRADQALYKAKKAGRNRVFAAD